MYILVASKRFRKQVKQLKKSNPLLLGKLETILENLRQGKPLRSIHKDHKLAGRLNDFRECHISPDWLLIYRTHEDLLVLELISTGTHSTIFE